MLRLFLLLGICVTVLFAFGITALDGNHNVAVYIYSRPEGGSLIRVETFNGVQFREGVPSPDIFDMVRERTHGYEIVYIEMAIDGELIGTSRIPIDRRTSLRRDGAPDDPGEILDDPEIELTIGRFTDLLYIESTKTGFGETDPNERITLDGVLSIKEQEIPPTADVGFGKVFVNNADGNLYYIDGAGNETDLTASELGVRSVSSSAHTEGRTSHMRFIPGSATDITESSENDTIYIQFSLVSDGTIPCTEAPSAPGTIAGPTEVCSWAQGVNYVVAPVAGAAMYLWELPPGAYITSGAGTNAIGVTFGSEGGTIRVTASNDCGSSDPSPAITVSVSPLTTPVSVSGEAIVCSGATGVSYSTSTVAGATGYLWTLPPGASLASGGGTENITVDFGTLGGNVCVKTENPCGISDPACMPVTVDNIPPTPGYINGATAVALNQYGVSYSISPVTGATSYSWTIEAGGASIPGSTTGTTVSVDFDGTSSDVEICVSAVNDCGTSPQSCITVKKANWFTNQTSWTTDGSASHSSYQWGYPVRTLNNQLYNYWSANATSGWIVYDFGTSRTLMRFRIYNDAANATNPKDCRLQTGPSLDGPWTTVHSWTSPNAVGWHETDEFESSSSRFWRLVVDNNYGSSDTRIYQVGFYGY